MITLHAQQVPNWFKISPNHFKQFLTGFYISISTVFDLIRLELELPTISQWNRRKDLEPPPSSKFKHCIYTDRVCKLLMFLFNFCMFLCFSINLEDKRIHCKYSSMIIHLSMCTQLNNVLIHFTVIKKQYYTHVYNIMCFFHMLAIIIILNQQHVGQGLTKNNNTDTNFLTW